MPKKTSGDASVASVATTQVAANVTGASLQGWLLKRGNRVGLWNDRYFVLQGNRFSYFDKEGDTKAKASLVISQEANCEIGSLYIDERQKGTSKKELLYCLKITWSTMGEPGKDDMEEASVFSHGTLSPNTIASMPVSPSRSNEAPMEVTPSTTKKQSHLRFLKSSSKKKPKVIRSQSIPEEDDGSVHSLMEPTERTSNKLHRRANSEGMFSDSASTSRLEIKESSNKRSSLKFRKSKKNKDDKPPKPPRVIRSATSDSARSKSEDDVLIPNLSLSASSMKEEGGDSEHSSPSRHARYYSDGNAVAMALANSRTDDTRTLSKSLPPEPTSPGRAQEQQLTITQYQNQQFHEQQLMQSLYYATKKARRKETKKKMVVGGKYAAAAGAAITVGVLTAGVGILAGMLFLSIGAAAAGGTGVAANATQKLKKKQREIIIGTTNYEEARQWKDALDACLVSESLTESTWGQMFVMEGRSSKSAVLPTAKLTRVRSNEFTDEWTSSPRDEAVVTPETRWSPMEGGWASMLWAGAHGLRICREERQTVDRRGKVSIRGCPNPPLKGQLVLNASPLDAFMCLMSLPRMSVSASLQVPLVPNSGQRASFRLVESIDEHMDIIHLVFRPLYLFPTWTAPRDFVLSRYWRLDPDGTYVVCCDSVKHRECPPHPGYVRGEMNGVYTISPRKKSILNKNPHNSLPPECLLTAVVQVDPRGWVPNKPVPLFANQGYGEAFGVSALLQVLDIRDAVDHDRFVPVDDSDVRTSKPVFNPNDFGLPSKRGEQSYGDLSVSRSTDTEDDEQDPINYDFSYSLRERDVSLGVKKPSISCTPPLLEAKYWAEPDPNSFRVRGKFYKVDKRKINAGSSIGRLVAVDVVYVEKPIYTGFCTHPTERVQLALERERKLKEQGLESDMPPFLYVVNILIPGPPYFHGVFYYAVDDISSIDGTDGTPSSKLCNEFFFGDSDEFRDKTFKLIPQIVEGNFVVRKAVGSTPAILGTKLRQLYARSDRFCEIIVDCGSSSVATGVIRLSLGYAKELVIDMGFLLEGRDESTLPERIFGCVRCKRILFSQDLRQVEQPPEGTPIPTSTYDVSDVANALRNDVEIA